MDYITELKEECIMDLQSAGGQIHNSKLMLMLLCTCWICQIGNGLLTLSPYQQSTQGCSCAVPQVAIKKKQLFQV